MRCARVWLALGFAVAFSWAGDKPVYTFGTTVVDSAGLEGHVYNLKRGTKHLPNFAHMRPVGTVYTTWLNVWPQKFDAGFPGLTDRFEWFAVEYTGKLWIENAGRYRFSLLADDGAKLYLNDQLIIDNDRLHNATAMSGGATLTRGVYEIKVDYYQGPRYTVALVLAVASLDGTWRIFNMTDFKPPNDPDKLEKGEVSSIEATTQ